MSDEIGHIFGIREFPLWRRAGKPFGQFRVDPIRIIADGVRPVSVMNRNSSPFDRWGHAGIGMIVSRHKTFVVSYDTTEFRKIDAGEIDADDRERHGDMQRGPDP